MATEVKSANGAAVRDNGDVTITFGIDKTKIGQGTTKNAIPTIYIPVTNPVSTSYVLDNVNVDFGGGADSGAKTGEVTDLWVYFGNSKVYHAGSNWTYTQTFNTGISSDFRVADASSYGIVVSLALSLPDAGSYINLYSVDLTFKEKK